MPELNAIRGLLELGWPAIVLVMNYILWRSLMQAKQDHIEDLRVIAGLKQTLAQTQSYVQGLKANPSPAVPAPT